MSGPVPAVTLVDGIPRVSSLDIAEKFGKRHDHVMRSIKELMDNCPKEFTAPNFGVSEYTDKTGRKLPFYLLSRDAFTLVTMGFTGQAALVWKLRYIEAFNAMEAELARRAKPNPLPNGWRERQNRLKRDEEHCTHNEGRPIEAAVNYWCSLRGIRRADALAAIRVRFGLRIFNRPPLHLHEDILNWISEQCGEDVSSLPTARPVKTPPRPEPCPLDETICLPSKHMLQRPPITLNELEMDAGDCQRRLGILCNGLALTAGTVRRDGPHALINEAIRDNLNAAHAAAQTALSLLKGIRNLCHAAQ